MPSSKCHQISLILGELYNDIKVIFPNRTPEQDKMILKQLSDAARRLDATVQETEKNCYDSGFNAAGGNIVKKEEEKKAEEG